MTQKNLKRALLISLIIGSLLNGINSYDVFLNGNFSTKNVVRIVLTYITPFCVSLYSSIKAARQSIWEDQPVQILLYWKHGSFIFFSISVPRHSANMIYDWNQKPIFSLFSTKFKTAVYRILIKHAFRFRQPKKCQPVFHTSIKDSSNCQFFSRDWNSAEHKKQN